MKKLTALLVSVAFLSVMFFSFNIFSFASQTVDIEKTRLGTTDTYYEFDASTKTLTISGRGATPNFTNSNTGSTAQPWFSWRSDGSISKVVVEEGITTLGNYFFSGMGTGDITIPSTLTRLNSYCFAYNSSMTQFDLKNITSLSNNVFTGCSRLTSITIPSGVTYIGNNAFKDCRVLEEVLFENMKSSLTIDRAAFVKCQSLKRVDVPRYAAVNTYAFGFKSENRGDVYDDFVLGVYSDSPAYTYAQKNYVVYELLTSMVIYENEVVSGSYFSREENGITDTNVNEKITYYFTPQTYAQYRFSSTGEVDVDCTLIDSQGNVLATASDNSLDDLNFTLTSVLEENETYGFVVESLHSLGSYQLGLTRLTAVGSASGTLKVMLSPDGELSNVTVAYAQIYDGNGVYLGQSDENGFFSVSDAYEYIRIVSAYGCPRDIYLRYGQNSLGDVGIVTYDYNKDGYVNAKDFAILTKMDGELVGSDKAKQTIDANGDGVLDGDDWQGAMSFATYGDIKSHIYNN